RFSRDWSSDVCSSDLSSNSLRMDSTNFELDDSTMKGNINISSFTPLAVNFNQTIDRLNFDQYQPSKSKSPEENTAEGKSNLSNQPKSNQSFDFTPLRDITIGGTVNIGSLTVGGTEFSQAHAQLLLQKGV